MPGYAKKFISLDLETTHLDMREGRIMEIGAIEAAFVYDPDARLVRAEFGGSLDLLVNPEVKPSPTALGLTGITEAELQGAPLWRETKSKVQEFLQGSVLLGHNLSFDLDFLRNQGVNLKNEFLDTLEMAQTFFPLLPSHSLEFLVQDRGIRTDASHRALADAKSTARLLAEVLNQYLRFPADLQKQLRNFLDKSSLGFREMFLDLPFSQTRIRPVAAQTGSRAEKQISKFTVPATLAGAWPDRSLFWLPLSFRQHEELLAGFAKRRQAGMVGVAQAEYLPAIPESRRLIDPAVALCEKRLQWLESQPAYSEIPAKILIKTAILRKNTQTWDLSLAKWAPDERANLRQILVDPAVCPKHGCGYVKSLQLKPRQTYFAGLAALFILAFSWEVDFSEQPLLLLDLGRVEEALMESQTELWNLRAVREALALLYPLGPDFSSAGRYGHLPKEAETLANELDLFFGILHLVYLKAAGTFAETILVDTAERESERFQKLIGPAENLGEKLKKFLAYARLEIDGQSGEMKLELEGLVQNLVALREFLRNFFAEPRPGQAYWMRFNSEWVDLNSAPFALGVAWRELEKKFAGVTLLDTQLPAAALQYFEKRLGIETFSATSLLSKAPRRPVSVMIAAQPISAAEVAAGARSLSGRTILIVPNESKLGEYHDLFFSVASPGQVALVYKFGGNLSVLKKRFAASPQAILILTTNIFRRSFFDLPPTDNLIITRLPFEAPGSKSSLLVAGTTNQFTEHALPRAVLILHSILSRFLSSGSPAPRVYLLDQRIASDYDRSFLKYLQEFPEFEISTGEFSKNRQA